MSVSKPPTVYRTVMNNANIDPSLFIAELSNTYEFFYVEKVNGFCNFLRNVLNKHASPYLRKDINHNNKKVFYLFRCVHSSMQPLRSVGRSNFDKGRHNLTTMIQKSTYINESCYIV